MYMPTQTTAAIPMIRAILTLSFISYGPIDEARIVSRLLRVVDQEVLGARAFGEGCGAQNLTLPEADRSRMSASGRHAILPARLRGIMAQ